MQQAGLCVIVIVMHFRAGHAPSLLAAASAACSSWLDARGDRQVTVNIAAWNLPDGTLLVHNLAGAGYMGEIYGPSWPLRVKGSNLTVTVPAYSTSTISAPLAPQVETALPCSDDATIFAGANLGSNYGASVTLSVGTSVTATHDATAVTLIKFVVPPTQA